MEFKKVWKELGRGEGKNLSLKGFPFPANRLINTINKEFKCLIPIPNAA